MTTRPLGAQISHMLKDRGVDVIFGIPGVHNQEMYRGIEEAGITHVLARHEQGAGFMADGYARATGKPGVAYVITGPGLCNIMTPMGQAYSDSVPMLVISSCLDETASKRGQLHQMKDQEGAAGTVCDWSETARTAQAAYGLIDRALMEFESQRPRPKHLSVSIQTLEAMANPSIANGQSVSVPQVERRWLQDACQRLSEARRPLFVFGGGAASSGVSPLDIVSTTGAAVLSTYAGRGVVPADYPLNFGSYLARPTSEEIINSADLVIAVGTSLSEVDLWRDDLGHSVPLIRVDIDPETAMADPSTEFALVGDARSFFLGLQEALEIWVEDKGRDIATTEWSPETVAATKKKWRAEIDAERPGIVPVADALKAALPPGTMIYSDMTQFAYAAKEVYPMDRPGHWHHPYGFGTLGYALPAAIGGKIGLGDQPVIAIAGDYGFQYTIQELAVELELTLPIIIWDNGKLGEIEDSMVRAQIAPNAVVQRNPDFCKLAEAYGAASVAPTDLASFQKAITDALATEGPTIIHVRSDIALTSAL